MNRGQQPELHVRVGPISIDAKGLAAIRAIRMPLALVIFALALLILAIAFGSYDVGLGPKLLASTKRIPEWLSSMNALSFPPLICTVCLVVALLVRRRFKK